MPKTIKFNLIVDGKPIRTLEQLRENFNIDDILQHYESGVLQRWLQVRELNTQLEHLKKITVSDQISIATEICKVFDAELTENELKSAVFHLEFKERHRKELIKFEKLNNKQIEIISEYHTNYETLCEKIDNNPEYYEFLKTALNEIWNKYQLLFEKDFERFFKHYVEKSPLLLHAMMGNRNFRSLKKLDKEKIDIIFNLIPDQDCCGDTITFEKDTNYNWELITKNYVRILKINNKSGHVKIRNKYGTEFEDKKSEGKKICGLSFYSYTSSDSVDYCEIIKKNIPKPYMFFSSETDGYWKDIEAKGKKYLIMKMEQGNFVRNAGKNGEELTAEDVNGKFIVLNGIDYKSNNEKDLLIYLEV